MDEITTQPPKPPSILELASPIVKHVELLSVVLENAKLVHNRHAAGEVLRVQQAFKVHSKFDSDFQGSEDTATWKRLVVFVACKLTGTKQADGGDPSEPELVIDAEFALTYKITAPEFGQPNLDAFAKTNGIFNLWPYWREFIQSTVVRMGLPPLTIGVLTQGTLVHLLVEQIVKDQAKGVP